MTIVFFAATCVAGGLGAALRFVADGLTRSWIRSRFPFGTALINISGSLILGLLTGLTLSAVLPANWGLILGAGLMGGYTTFSTASVETMRLVQDREYTLAFTNGFVLLIISILVGLGGLWIGSVLHQ